MLSLLHSYVGAFNDGENHHYGFKLKQVLYVITSSVPRNSYVKIDTDSVFGKHIRETKQTFLTLATNQLAKRFNNIPAGKILLPEDFTINK